MGHNTGRMEKSNNDNVFHKKKSKWFEMEDLDSQFSVYIKFSKNKENLEDTKFSGDNRKYIILVISIG